MTLRHLSKDLDPCAVSTHEARFFILQNFTFFVNYLQVSEAGVLTVLVLVVHDAFEPKSSEILKNKVVVL